MPKRKKAIEVETEEEIKASQIEEQKAFEDAKLEDEVSPLKTDEELTKEVEAQIFKTAPKEEKLAKGMVKVKVLVGTLKFDEFTYEKGDVFTVSRKRTEGFDPRFFEIL